ncbi:NADP-dependent oxidoreductase domain-containing protein [Mycena leptocephala]|nr:NADP-dependent oxidoreductase domain-containing protein [Mycena leptocephala]
MDLQGAGSYGLEGVAFARVTDKATGQQLVDIFLKAGGKTIDTARQYANGTSEKFLAQLDVKAAHIDTKIYATQPGGHAPENLRRTVKESVEALGPHKINVLYLHAPDRSVPFVNIAREINELHKEGLFREFGLSNFYSWEVAEFYFIAEKNGWIRPTVYQGVYNLLERQAETELFPFLKKFGIRFYGYSPLAGSVLAGKDLDVAVHDGSRFDTKAVGDFIGQYYTGRYFPLIPAAQELREEGVKYGLSLPEIAFRWLQHHSEFGKISDGDAIVIGSSSIEQLNQSIAWSEEGLLQAEVVKLVDDLFARNKGPLHHYAPSTPDEAPIPQSSNLAKTST